MRVLAPREDALSHDDVVILHSVSWADYQRILRTRGDGPGPRIAYLDGELELMSPSLPHEGIKSVIGRLVEVWCLEHEIEFRTAGSWTLGERRKGAGVEPDECYIFSPAKKPERPELAIEVIWTSGRLDKLEIYRRLGVREVWYWDRGQLTVHSLRGDKYVRSSRSRVLKGIDLAQLASFLDRPTTSQAIREYRAALQRRV